MNESGRWCPGRVRPRRAAGHVACTPSALRRVTGRPGDADRATEHLAEAERAVARVAERIDDRPVRDAFVSATTRGVER